MDEVSRTLVEKHCERLARWAEPISEDCALLKITRRWDRFVDGTAEERESADFARYDDGPPLASLVDQAASGCADLGLRPLDYDSEWERHVFRAPNGDGVVRLWSVKALLFEGICETLRLDSSRALSSEQPTVEPSPFIHRVVEVLGAGPPMVVSVEVYLDPDAPDRVQAICDSASFHAAGDIAGALRENGFEPPLEDGGAWSFERQTADFRQRLGAFLRPDRISLELETMPL